MRNNTNDQSPELRDVLYAFSIDEREPNAELLDEYVRQHAEHAEALMEFAIDLALDRLRESCESPVNEAQIDRAMSPLVSRAISAFHNRLHQLKHAGQAQQAKPAVPAAVTNPFAKMNRDAFRAVAKGVHANAVLLAKFRDRLVEPATIPLKFVQRLSDQMRVSIDELRAHFEAPMSAAVPGQMFKSDGKPQATARQSFIDAVNSSGLDAESEKELLSL